MVQIVDMVFSPQDVRLRLDLNGEPEECINRAKEIATAVISPIGLWKFISIEGRGATPTTFHMKIIIEHQNVSDR